jgi:hypothetical protein
VVLCPGNEEAKGVRLLSQSVFPEISCPVMPVQGRSHVAELYLVVAAKCEILQRVAACPGCFLEKKVKLPVT